MLVQLGLDSCNKKETPEVPELAYPWKRTTQTFQIEDDVNVYKFGVGLVVADVDYGNVIDLAAIKIEDGKIILYKNDCSGNF